jgi:hypothetical protein
MRNKMVRPIGFVLNQAGAYWVLTNVRKLLSQTFVMAKPMIEEISLPLYARQFGSNPFVIANELRKRVTTINADQSVEMIWHKQEKVQIPSSPLVIHSCRIEQYFRGSLVAQLICSALLTANGDEVDRSKAPCIMRRVIKSFTQPARHWKIVATISTF